MAQLQGIVTVSQVGEMKFDLNEPDVPIGEFLGHIGKKTFITAYGKPGSSKSTFYVQLAVYLTKFGFEKAKKTVNLASLKKIQE